MNRSLIIQVFIVMVGLTFAIRLLSIQIFNEDYKLAAENNVIQKIIDYPYRGLVYDRNNSLMVFNTPVYDLMIVPKEAELNDSTRLCQLLQITHREFIEKYEKARSFSPILASKFMEQIPNSLFASVQDQLVSFSGFYALPRTVRDYSSPVMANTIGYVGEVDRRTIRNDTTNYYKSGDFIGITGVEKEYEKYLRGKRGTRYQMVNVQGVVKGAFKDGEYDTVPIPGENIQLTIDLELQEYAEKLLKGKVGGVVALNPATGEILTIASYPSYDPASLSGRDRGKNFLEIQNDTLKPLFNRPLQATYPPGSMFKVVQSLIALEEGMLGPNEKIMCEGGLIGDHAPPGLYDVRRAIEKSSNNFYFKVFKRVIQQGYEESAFLDSRIGLGKWHDYITKFGLGRKLGVDIPNESPGFAPSLSYYDRIYGENRWKFSNIYSLSIGQGELLVTPIQMANLCAIVANKGYYITPHIVKSIDNEPLQNFARNEVGISEEHFDPVIDGMEQVVLYGSGLRARMPDISVCGKTSTVENPHGEDHSGFMGFAPKDNPQIAVAAYVENAGWGARAAAATASLIIEKYLNGEIKRTWLEDYVLKGDFADKKVEKVEKKDTLQLKPLKEVAATLQ
ncbi:MAG: penicillin-binding transpeptidase domain-containing protein [Cyclobacteriaceae bacterium]